MTNLREPRQARAPRLAGDAERAIMRRKDAAELNGDVFLQQRDEAAAVGRSAMAPLSDQKPPKCTTKPKSSIYIDN